jgi:hypothetical protein
MKGKSPAWEKTFFVRLRLALEAFSAIPRCIRSPSMSFGVHQFAAFQFEIFYELTVESITISLYFTAHKIHRSGASVSGGLRIIYFVRYRPDEFWMLTLYAKAKRENIPAHILKQLLEAFRDE